jgi:hypothetical protein
MNGTVPFTEVKTMSSTSETKGNSGLSGSGDKITIPLSLLHKMSDAARAFEEFQDDLEDYLISQDDSLITRIRQARAHHLEGQIHSLDELKQKLCIE